MRKILFSDMDGTIINLHQLRHASDKKKLEALREAGHLIVFNTGRNFQEAHFCIDQHQLPYDYLVLNNGAHIVDCHHQDLFKQVIPQDVGRKIIEYTTKIPDIYTFFYNGQRTLGYYNGKTVEQTPEGIRDVLDLSFHDEYAKVQSFEIIAVHHSSENPEKVLDIQAHIHKHYADYAQGIRNTFFLDITPAHCNKGTGVLKLKSFLDEDVETYSIGDSYNDIEMFQVSDHSYTFPDVALAIKEHAKQEVDYVYHVIDDMLKGESYAMAKEVTKG